MRAAWRPKSVVAGLGLAAAVGVAALSAPSHPTPLGGGLANTRHDASPVGGAATGAWPGGAGPVGGAPLAAAGEAVLGATSATSGPAGGPAGAGRSAGINPTDPHRAGTPGAKVPALAFQPDSTPAAAAASLEPGSVAPLTLPAGWTSSVVRFAVGNLQRSYLVVRPAAVPAGSRLPVVVMLHGRNLTPAIIERITNLPPVTGPAVLVYPAGYGRSWDAGGCCGQAYKAGIDDVGFLTQVVHRVVSGVKGADIHQVYVMGFSNGGRMAYRLACADPGTFAGIAAVEAVPIDECRKTDPVPVVVVANRYDPLLTIEENGRPKVIYDSTEPTVESVVDTWQRLDGCSTAVTTTVEGRLVAERAGGCKDAARVAFVEYGDGGHLWHPPAPGTPGASAVVWSLLRSGTLPPPPPTLVPSTTQTSVRTAGRSDGGASATAGHGSARR